MKKIILSIVLLFSSLVILPATAQDQLSPRLSSQVAKAFELEQSDKLTEAIILLEKLNGRSRYEKAYIARLTGIYYWQANQPKKAITQLTLSLESEGFDLQQSWQTEKMLAELLLSQHQAKLSLPHFKHLIQLSQELELTEAQLASLHLNTAKNYYLLEQWYQVLTSLNNYAKFVPTFPLQVLKMRFNAELQLKQYKNAINTNKQILTLDSSQALWWQQLSALYLQVKDNRSALATLLSAERAGITLNLQYQEMMAQLYGQQKVPEQAALRYQSIDDPKLRVLVQEAQSWQTAKEWQKAQQAWLVAAKVESKYYRQVSELALLQGEYQAALNYIDKGKNIDEEQKYRLKLRAYVGLKQYTKAQKIAEQLHRKYPTQSSISWLEYLDKVAK
ncbi:hypothetical protein L0B53_15380 [Vibrio sp. SS-MA-C1-2]|uniref:tetratricopeptide repeat protein n=1 Tax=Vibrio sp. SS-MA-C1-2 TaxID=2908646 RepID=UPI001F32D71D|nr:hypothetical protein [Vibrio sp. SS-MA-C1-2]UJF18389.1 hypothetical protein L0B53_15380 [Vibrio sp. SS-MA-C1-2]